MTLTKLAEDAKAFALSQIADTLVACNLSADKNAFSLRKQIVDACTLLLSVRCLFHQRLFEVSHYAIASVLRTSNLEESVRGRLAVLF